MISDLALLREHGVVVVRDAFPRNALGHLRQAAEACDFTPFSYSVSLAALPTFRELLDPTQLLVQAVRDDLTCNLEHSWVRKRFAPRNAPRLYQPNTWHQDGGLGVAFSQDPESVTPLTGMVTCWIPLQPCGDDCPGLEFVRQSLDVLLHYSELTDLRLSNRFAPEQFWAPTLELGDGVLFLAGTLHRTHVLPEMRRDRLSVEYRFMGA